MWTGAGGNELVTFKECTVWGYAGYQLVINHTAGADPTTSVTWLINKPAISPSGCWFATVTVGTVRQNLQTR